jgi:hypothetical protein
MSIHCWHIYDRKYAVYGRLPKCKRPLTVVYDCRKLPPGYILSLTQPIELELKKKFNLNLNLLDLRKIASDRNIYAHQSIDTVDQQKDFLDEC